MEWLGWVSGCFSMKITLSMLDKYEGLAWLIFLFSGCYGCSYHMNPSHQRPAPQYASCVISPLLSECWRQPPVKHAGRVLHFPLPLPSNSS